MINYNFDLRASYFQKGGSKCIRKVKSIKTQSDGNTEGEKVGTDHFKSKKIHSHLTGWVITI